MATVPGIYKKVNKLMARIGAIPKEHSVTEGGRYSYRSYADLFQKMQPIMVELGLVHETRFEPTMLGQCEMITKNGNKTGTIAAGVFKVIMIDIEDGSSMMWEAPSIGYDTSDKAGGKAASYGIKTALFTGLEVPVDEERDQDEVRYGAVSPSGRLDEFLSRAGDVSASGMAAFLTEAKSVLTMAEQAQLAQRLRGLKGR